MSARALFVRLAAAMRRVERWLIAVDRMPGGLLLASILLFALVRGAHLAWSWNAPLLKDAIEYDHLGWLTAQGRSWVNWLDVPSVQLGPVGTPTAARMPGLPLFLAAVYSVTGHVPTAGRLALVLLNALAAGALWHAARKLYGIWPAVMATVAWTFWPVSVRGMYYVDSLLAESLAIPLVIFAIWALARETWLGAILAGLCSGMAVLTRANLALAVPMAFVLAIVAFRHRRRQRSRMAVAMLLGGLCLVPWTVRNYEAFGKFMPLSSQSGLAAWVGWARGTETWVGSPEQHALIDQLGRRYPRLMEAPEPEKAAILRAVAAAEMSLAGPQGVIKRAAWKAWSHLQPWEEFYGLHSWLLVATLLAFFAGRSAWSSSAALFASSVWLGVFATGVLTYYMGRYRFVSTPALLFLSAAGLEQVIRGQRWVRSLRHFVRSGRSENGSRKRSELAAADDLEPS